MNATAPDVDGIQGEILEHMKPLIEQALLKWCREGGYAEDCGIVIGVYKDRGSLGVRSRRELAKPLLECTSIPELATMAFDLVATSPDMIPVLLCFNDGPEPRSPELVWIKPMAASELH